MFIEYWMLAIFIVIAGLWGEYRYKKGENNGTEKIVEQAKSLLIKERLSGSYATMLNLIKKGVLKMDKSKVIGYNDITYELNEELISFFKEDIDNIQKKK